MSQSIRINWRPILLEAAFVVLGVFLALVANEWWAGVKRAQAAEGLLKAVQEELLNNRALVSSSVEYHFRIAGQIQQALAAGASLEAADFDQGFMSQRQPLSSAWQTVLEANALPDLPVGVVLSLSRTYQEQERYDDQRRTVGELIYRSMFNEGLGGLAARPGSHLAMLGSFMYVECGLIGHYGDTLGDIGSQQELPSAPEACAYLPRRGA